MTLQRTRLLARLFASEPRLIRLCAPPGYGKSALVRLLARRFERHAMCECAGVDDLVRFADRALAALAGESPEGGDAIAATRLRLHATEADAAAWSRALLECWKGRQEHALFVLEHTEHVGGNPAILALLGDLLAARPSERVVLISSRVMLPLRAAHYLAPHQILTLSRSEFCLEPQEAGEIFEGTGLAPDIVERIVRLAGGYPIVLLLLALFAHYDANIETLLERLQRIPPADLYEHLANDVLAAFTPDMMATMLAIASIPSASLEDISAATGIRHATPIIDRLLRLPGFISSDKGVYQAHPLLLDALRARHGTDLTNSLLAAARDYERSGDALRAAELYSAYGDEAAAADALDHLPSAELALPSSRVIDVLANISMSTLCRYPNVWIATLPYRRQSVAAAVLYDEGRGLLASLEPAASGSLVRRLRLRLAMLAQEREKLSEALALMEARGPLERPDDTPEERRLVLMTAALIAARRGRFSEADRFGDESDAVHGARHVRFEAERAQIALEKARFLGDWHGALKLSEEELYAAQRSGATSRIIDAARAVARAAWYCNDDARATAADQLLEFCDDRELRAPARPIARWHAALATPDAAEAQHLFDAAIDEIDTVENDFLRIVIRVCAALLLPGERPRLFQARAIAQHVESPTLQASLELLIESADPADHGMFKYLAQRVARSPLNRSQDVLRLEIVRGHVRRGTDALHVSERGLELLAALALLPAGTPKKELAAAIWPSLDGDGALNALKMCISRTRAQLADRDAIASTKRSYALSERVAVDVRGFERLLHSVRATDALGDAARRQVEEALRELELRECAPCANWVWFAPYAAQLDKLRDGYALVLAKDGWRRNDAAAFETAAVAAT